MNSVDIGLAGAGTIGCGVYKTISENAGLIEKRTGVGLCIRKIADPDMDRKLPVLDPSGAESRYYARRFPPRRGKCWRPTTGRET